MYNLFINLKVYKRINLWICIIYEGYLIFKFKLFEIFFNGYIVYVSFVFFKFLLNVNID